MAYRNLGNKVHLSIHLISIAGIAIGLPLNKIVMSIAMMVGVLNLLIEADFKSYIFRLRNEKAGWFIIGLWILHVIGLIWTQEFDFALNDLRVKLPLLVIPFLLIAKPLENKSHRQLILKLFLLSLTTTSIFNFAAYQQWIGHFTYTDIRGLSLFGSHIRYGILVALGAVISLYFTLKIKNQRWIYLSLFIWLCYYTYFSQIISGMLGLVTGVIALAFYFINQRNRIASFLFGFAAFVLPVIFGVLNYTMNTQNSKVVPDYTSLPSKTAEGNEYIHYFVEQKDSKGDYLFINLCEKELKREWQKVSHYDYDGKDRKGQMIRFTLIRYMTSMNLRKDAKDFKKLTPKDVHNIESGIAEINEGRSGIFARLNGVRFQLDGKSDPNGHSLLQRLEYWKTGMKIIRENWAFGVGSGDVQVAFDQQYEKDHSALYPENRLRAHNSYITMWVTFGLIGIVLFIWMLTYFTVKCFRSKNALGFVFALIAISTFFLEDTLETQTGVTFFAFFYALLIPKSSVNFND